MKIGLLYICTGKYTIFWKDFYLSCEKNFITEAEKHYFVFTDSTKIEFETNNPKIHRIFQKNLGWPLNTLKRYHIFLKSKEVIEKMDYLFYINANLLFLENISKEEFLPIDNNTLVGCLHPGYYNKNPNKFNYERRPESKAFIKKGEGKYYFAGGINGGKTQDFLKAIMILNKNIEIDIKNKIIAKWHDESHWNWYLNKHLDSIKILDPSYLYPEGLTLPFPKKILIRDKTLLGGHSNLRDKIEIRIILSNAKKIIKKLLKLS